MINVKPVCHYCGCEDTRYEHVNTVNKQTTYRCNRCNRKFTECLRGEVVKPAPITCPRCHMPNASFVEHECDNSLGHVETRRCRCCKRTFGIINGMVQKPERHRYTPTERDDAYSVIYGGNG